MVLLLVITCGVGAGAGRRGQGGAAYAAATRAVGMFGMCVHVCAGVCRCVQVSACACVCAQVHVYGWVESAERCVRLLPPSAGQCQTAWALYECGLVPVAMYVW
jgi:hypothetical protein